MLRVDRSVHLFDVENMLSTGEIEVKEINAVLPTTRIRWP